MLNTKPSNSLRRLSSSSCRGTPFGAAFVFEWMHFNVNRSPASSHSRHLFFIQSLPTFVVLCLFVVVFHLGSALGYKVTIDPTRDPLLLPLDLQSLPNSAFSKGPHKYKPSGAIWETKVFRSNKPGSGSGGYGPFRYKNLKTYVMGDGLEYAKATWGHYTVDLATHPDASGGVVSVTGVAVKGFGRNSGKIANCHIQSFRVSYLPATGDWKWIRTAAETGPHREPKIFRTYSYRGTGELFRFGYPVAAKMVRIYPLTPNNPCARFELFSGNTLVATLDQTGSTVTTNAARVAHLNHALSIVDNNCGYVFADVSCTGCQLSIPAPSKESTVKSMHGSTLVGRTHHKWIVGAARDVSASLSSMRVLINDGFSGTPQVTVRSGLARGPEGQGLVQLVANKKFWWNAGSGHFLNSKVSFQVGNDDIEEKSTISNWGSSGPAGTWTDFFIAKRQGRVYFPKTQSISMITNTDDQGRLITRRATNSYIAGDTNPDEIRVEDWGLHPQYNKYSTDLMHAYIDTPYDFTQEMMEHQWDAGMNMLWANSDTRKAEFFENNMVYRCLYHEESATMSITVPASPPATAFGLVVSSGDTSIPIAESTGTTAFDLKLSANPGKTVLIGHEHSTRLEMVPDTLVFDTVTHAVDQTVTLEAKDDSIKYPTEDLPLAFPSCRGRGTLGDLSVIGTTHVLSGFAYITDVTVAAGSLTINVDSTADFSAGSEVLLYQTQHATEQGHFEFGYIDSLTSTSITLESPTTRSFASGSPEQNPSVTAQVVLVHEFASVKVGFVGKLTCDGWDGRKGGILAMRAQKSIEQESNGVIDVSGLGFRGGGCGNCGVGDPGIQGESHCGLGNANTDANCNGGGGGSGVNKKANNKYAQGAAGGSGGNAVAGSNSEGGDDIPSTGGDICYVRSGGSGLEKTSFRACFGGGGGGGGSNSLYKPLPIGGNGGGVVFAYARTWSKTMTILSRGGDAVGAENNNAAISGAGAGGTVIIGGLITPEAGISVKGGTGMSYGDDNVGNGGDGFVRVLGPDDCFDGSETAFAAAKVQTTDNDPKLTIDVASPGITSIAEGGASVYTVTLNNPPPPVSAGKSLSVDIVVEAIAVPASMSVTLMAKPPVLFFTDTDYSTPHTFTVLASDDDVSPPSAIQTRVTFRGTTDSDKEILTENPVDATMSNNDVAGIVTIPVRQQEQGGDWGIGTEHDRHFQLKLTSKPTSDVTVHLVPGTHGTTHKTNAMSIVIQPENFKLAATMIYLSVRDGIIHAWDTPLSAEFTLESADLQYNNPTPQSHVIGLLQDGDRGYADDRRCSYSQQFVGRPLTVVCEMIIRHVPVAGDADFHLLFESKYKESGDGVSATVISGFDGTLDVKRTAHHDSTASRVDGLEYVLQRGGGTTIPVDTKIQFSVLGIITPTDIIHPATTSALDGLFFFVSRRNDPAFRTHFFQRLQVTTPMFSSPHNNVAVFPRFVLKNHLTEKVIRTSGDIVLKFYIEGTTKFKNKIVSNNDHFYNSLKTFKSKTNDGQPNAWNAHVSKVIKKTTTRFLSEDKKTLFVRIPGFPEYAPPVADDLTWSFHRDIIDFTSTQKSAMLTGGPTPNRFPCDDITTELLVCSRILRSLYVSLPSPVVVSSGLQPIVLEAHQPTNLVVAPSMDASTGTVGGFTGSGVTMISSSSAEFKVDPVVTGNAKITLSTQVVPSTDFEQFESTSIVELPVSATLISDMPSIIRRSFSDDFVVTVSTSFSATVRINVAASQNVNFIRVDELLPSPTMLFVDSNTRSFSFIPSTVGNITFSLTPAQGLQGGKDAAYFIETFFTTKIVESFTTDLPSKVPIGEEILVLLSMTANAFLNVSIEITGGAEFRYPGNAPGTVSVVREIDGVNSIPVPIYTKVIGPLSLKVKPLSGSSFDVYLETTFDSVITIPLTMNLPSKLYLDVMEPGAPLVLGGVANVTLGSSAIPKGNADFFYNITANDPDTAALYGSSPPAPVLYANVTYSYWNASDGANASSGTNSSSLVTSSYGYHYVEGGNITIMMPHNDTEVTFGITARYCGPVTIEFSPVAGLDAAKVASAVQESFAYVHGEPSDTQFEGFTVYDTSGSIWNTSVTLGDSEPEASEETSANDTDAVKANTAPPLYQVLPEGVSSVRLSVLSGRRVCSVAVDGVDIVHNPDTSFEVSDLAPRIFDVLITPGDAVSVSNTTMVLARVCGPGMFLSDKGVGYCIPCPRNSISTGGDARECTPCVDSYTTTHGSSECLPCDLDLSIGGPYPPPALRKTGLGSLIFYVQEDVPRPLGGLLFLTENTYPYKNELSVALSFEMTLQTSSGTITIAESINDASIPGLAFIEGSFGAPASKIVVAGPVSSLNTLVSENWITFAPTDNMHGTASFKVSVSDPSSGIGCHPTRESTTELVSIVVQKVNDPPIVTIAPSSSGNSTASSSPGGSVVIFLSEDGSFNLRGMITANDVDELSSLVTFLVTLEVEQGAIELPDLSTHSGITIEGGASGTPKVKFAGNPVAVRALLQDDIRYVPNDNFNGNDRLLITVSDTETTSAVYIGTGLISIAVSAVNDKQTITDADPATLVGYEDTAFVIEGISVEDIDQSPTAPLALRVRLSVSSGTIQLGSGSGVKEHGTSNSVSLTSAPSIDIDGESASAVNNALRGLRFVPPPDFTGTSTFTIKVTDRVYGSDSETMLATKQFVLTVKNRDDLTEVVVDGSSAKLVSDAVLVSSSTALELWPISLSDVEAHSTLAGFKLRMSVLSGKLSLNDSLTNLGVSDPASAVISSDVIEVSGAIATLNKVLVSMRYTNTFATSTSDTLHLTTWPVSLMTSRVDRQWSITTCQAGGYLDESVNSCRQCLAGSYSTKNGANRCELCPAGTFQGEVGSTSCELCAPGMEAPTEGLARCTACRAGTYRGTTVPSGNVTGTSGGVSSGGDGGVVVVDDTSGNSTGTANGTVAVRMDGMGLSRVFAVVGESVFDGGKKKGDHAVVRMSARLSALGVFGAREDMPLQCQACPQGTYSDSEGSVTCLPCPPGTFNSGSGFAKCIECIKGTFSPGGNSLCKPCAPGSFASRDGQYECVPCPTGQFQSDQGQVKCNECPVDFFAETEGSSRCTACPGAEKGTHGKTGSTSVFSCECNAGWYGPAGEGECTNCPIGGICHVGTSIPGVQSGYWRQNGNATDFYPCIPSRACLGSSNTSIGDACAAGYDGFRCGVCFRDEASGVKYYRVGDECRPCPTKTGWSMVLIFILFIIVVGLLMVFGRAGVRFGTVQIAINFFQMLSLFSAFRLEWPPIVVEFFSWMSIFAFNIEVLHPECEVKMDYFDKSLMILTLPFVFLGMFVAIFTVYYAFDKLRFRRQMERDNLEEGSVEFRDVQMRRETKIKRMFFLCCASLTILLSVLYTTLASRSLAFFDCTRAFDGRYLMDASPTDECLSKRWYKFLWIGVFGLVAYVVVWPIVLVLSVRKARSDSRAKNVVMQILSPLLSNYRSKYLGWELVLMGRKATIIMSSLFFTESALYQAVGGIITLLFAGVLQAHAKPFVTFGNNVCEFISLVISSLVLIFGLAIFSGQSTPEESENLGYVIVGLAIFGIIALLIGALIEIQQAWSTLRRAVDFHKYTNEENVMCLRRVINTASEGQVRDWLQHMFEQEQDLAHKQLWEVLQLLSAEVMAFHASKEMVRGETLSGTLSGGTAEELQRLKYAKYRVQRHLTSTHALSEFTSGILQDSAAPTVREWLRERASAIERGVATRTQISEVMKFVTTFASISLLRYREEQDSKDLWHADQEAKYMASRWQRELRHMSASTGDDDIDEAALVADLAGIDRAVTAVLVPMLWGEFGDAWIKAMATITESSDLGSLALYRRTLRDLHRAYMAQLALNRDNGPSQRLIATLPKKYRRTAQAVAEAGFIDAAESDEDTSDEFHTQAKLKSKQDAISGGRRVVVDDKPVEEGPPGLLQVLSFGLLGGGTPTGTDDECNPESSPESGEEDEESII